MDNEQKIEALRKLAVQQQQLGRASFLWLTTVSPVNHALCITLQNRASGGGYVGVILHRIGELGGLFESTPEEDELLARMKQMFERTLSDAGKLQLLLVWQQQSTDPNWLITQCYRDDPITADVLRLVRRVRQDSIERLEAAVAQAEMDLKGVT